MSDTKIGRILIPVTTAVLLAYYLFFVWPGLKLYFDNDDMMNLYFAWSKPLMETYRPLGALFYRTMFSIAGFNPLPFRIACVALGAVNMGLCFWFSKLVTASNRVAALSVLLFAFHSRMMEVWYRTAVVYDLLCFTFFYLALCLYMSRPRVGIGRGVAVIACFIAALEAKEIAIVLPAILLGIRYSTSELRRVSGSLWVPLTCGLIDIPYLWFKTHGANALTNIADYQPEYSFSRFAHTWALYLNYLFVQKDQIAPWMAVAILVALLLGALRSRKLTFAWIMLFVPVLPVAFLAYRGAFVLYASYPGWTLYAAIALVALQDLIPVNRTALACLVFAVVGWRFGKLNLHDQRSDARTWLYQSPAQVREMAQEIPELEPHLPKGARCLFVNDAFSTGEWTPNFIMKLLYHDDTLVPDRVKMMSHKPADWSSYQYVFTYEGGKYLRLKP